MIVKAKYINTFMILMLNGFNVLSADSYSDLPNLSSEMDIAKVYHYLEEANYIVKSIKDPEEKAVLICLLNAYKEQFQTDYLLGDYRALNEHILFFYENLDEIILSCKECEKKDSIKNLINKMIIE